MTTGAFTVFVAFFAAQDQPSPPPRPAVAQPPSGELEQGRLAFARNEFRKAIDILLPLVEPVARVNTDDEIVDVRRMLGIAYTFERSPYEARRHFVELLRLRPDFRLNPVMESPEVVKRFQEIVQEQEDALRRLKEAVAAEEARRKAAAAEEEKIVVERRIKVNNHLLNFVPFGVGQFQNGDRKKGVAFLTSEIVLGGTSLGFMAANYAIYGFAPRYKCRDGAPDCASADLDRSPADRSRLYTYISVGTGALFWGVVAWGITDALINFVPEVPGGEVERRVPAKNLPASRARSRAPFPFVTDRGFGLGGRF